MAKGKDSAFKEFQGGHWVGKTPAGSPVIKPSKVSKKGHFSKKSKKVSSDD